MDPFCCSCGKATRPADESYSDGDTLYHAACLDKLRGKAVDPDDDDEVLEPTPLVETGDPVAGNWPP